MQSSVFSNYHQLNIDPAEEEEEDREKSRRISPATIQNVQLLSPLNNLIIFCLT